MKKKFLPISLIVIGITAIVLSIICFTLSVGFEIDYEKYGGDAYTGIQHACARTARNIVDTNTILRLGFGSALLISGIISGCIGVNGLLLSAEKAQPHVVNDCTQYQCEDNNQQDIQ